MVAIVRRAQWGAQFSIPGGRFVAPGSRRFFVVHWPAGAVSGDERAAVRAIERSHRVGQGWQAAPGYNFLVGRSGTVYEGAGRDIRGIHSPPRNTDGWGVCVLVAIGETPPPACLNAVRALYAHLNGVAGRTLAMSWHGQHFATECPGPALRSWVQRGMPAPGGAAVPAPAPAAPAQPGGKAPEFPASCRPFVSRTQRSRCPGVKPWQEQMLRRGWKALGAADGIFGPKSEAVLFAFQREKGLTADKLLGPASFAAAWTAPVT